MRDPKRKSVLTLAVSLAVTAAVLCAAIFYDGSVAWWAMNKEVRGGGLSISAYDEASISVKVDHYEIFKREADGVSFVGSAQIDMNEYDAVFPARNVNTPLVIRVSLGELKKECGVIIKATARSDYKDQNNKILPCSSNIVGIRACQISRNEAYKSIDTYDAHNKEKAASIYEEATSFFKDQAPTTFVRNGAKPLKTIEIDAGTVTPDNEGNAVIYIEIDYVEELVNAYIRTNGISIALPDEDSSAEAGSDVQPCAFDIASFGVLSYELPEDRENP